MLYALQRKLVKKIKVINKGYKIRDLKFQTFAEWQHKKTRDSKSRATERMTSNITEGEPTMKIDSQPPLGMVPENEPQKSITEFKTIKRVSLASERSKAIKKPRV